MVVCLFSSDGWGEGNTGNLPHQFPGRVMKGTEGFVCSSARGTASVRATQMLCRAETVYTAHTHGCDGAGARDAQPPGRALSVGWA